MKTKHYTIPVFIPELACPFQCVFCNQKKISGKLSVPVVSEVKAIIEKHLSTIDFKNSCVEIGFFGGNFTGLPLKEQEAYLKTAFVYLKTEKINSIRLSTRPDYINDKVLELLRKYGVKTIELGAQSMDPEVLKLNGRGHSVGDVVAAAEKINSYNFDLGLQMMIGLPGDTQYKAMDTARKIVELRASNTRIYPALVIAQTKLEEAYNRGEFTPLSLAETILWCKELLKIFEAGKVKVIRLGLHPSEGILSGKDLVAGPFHPALRQMVYTELWADEFIDIPEKYKEEQKIEIWVCPDQVNYAAGYLAKNKKRLAESFQKVLFRKDTGLKGREFYVRPC